MSEWFYKLLRPSHNAQVCLTKTSFLLLKSKKTIIFTADKVEHVMTVGFLRPRIQVGITPVTRRQSFKNLYTKIGISHHNNPPNT